MLGDSQSWPVPWILLHIVIGKGLASFTSQISRMSGNMVKNFAMGCIWYLQVDWPEFSTRWSDDRGISSQCLLSWPLSISKLSRLQILFLHILTFVLTVLSVCSRSQIPMVWSLKSSDSFVHAFCGLTIARLTLFDSCIQTLLDLRRPWYWWCLQY